MTVRKTVKIVLREDRDQRLENKCLRLGNFVNYNDDTDDAPMMVMILDAVMMMMMAVMIVFR